MKKDYKFSWIITFSSGVRNEYTSKNLSIEEAQESRGELIEALNKASSEKHNDAITMLTPYIGVRGKNIDCFYISEIYVDGTAFIL